jgi:hypothetical protein
MPYVVAKSWNQEFEAMIQVHKLPSFQRQIALHAQKIHVHTQGMLPFFLYWASQSTHSTCSLSILLIPLKPTI